MYILYVYPYILALIDIYTYIFIYTVKAFYHRFGSICRKDDKGIIKKYVIGYGAQGCGSLIGGWNPIIEPYNVGKTRRTAMEGGCCGFVPIMVPWSIVYACIDKFDELQDLFKTIMKNMDKSDFGTHHKHQIELLTAIKEVRLIFDNALREIIINGLFHKEFLFFDRRTNSRPLHKVNMNGKEIINWDEIWWAEQQENNNNNNNNNKNNNNNNNDNAMDVVDVDEDDEDEDDDDEKQPSTKLDLSSIPTHHGPYYNSKRGKVIAYKGSIGGQWQQHQQGMIDDDFETDSSGVPKPRSFLKGNK